jgi:hypothetical protein
MDLYQVIVLAGFSYLPFFVRDTVRRAKVRPTTARITVVRVCVLFFASGALLAAWDSSGPPHQMLFACAMIGVAIADIWMASRVRRLWPERTGSTQS